jgi:hypothetical protein
MSDGVEPNVSHCAAFITSCHSALQPLVLTVKQIMNLKLALPIADPSFHEAELHQLLWACDPGATWMSRANTTDNCIDHCGIGARRHVEDHKLAVRSR